MSGGRQLRVLILSAEEGEGHRAVARALSADLASENGDVDVVVRDALEGLGRVIPFLTRDVYRKQLNNRFSWTYGIECNVFARFPPGRGVARGGLVLFGGRPLLRLIRSHDPDVLVSTHPAATSIIGHYRRRGKLEMPALATVSDFGVHPLWAHPGIDLHFVMHESCIRPIERVAGKESARVTRPLVQPDFFSPADGDEARRAAGLPLDAPVVLVSGGGWGVGKLERAVRAGLALEGARVVCICGLNEGVRERLDALFGDEPRVRILGFTDQMRELMAASDVVVHSTGGVTCLEALVLGKPLIAFGVPPGHARWNAKAIAALGMGETARSQEQLTEALRRAVLRREARFELDGRRSAATFILNARARASAANPRRRTRRLAAAFVAATMIFAGWTFASAAPYPLVSRVLHLRPLTSVKTNRPEVALIIQAPAQMIPTIASSLERRHVTATFAVETPPSGNLMARLRKLGDETLPAIDPKAPPHWLAAGRSVKRDARALGLRHGFYYLVPKSFSLGEYVVARAMGGHPLSGAVRFEAGARLPAKRPQAGDVVVVTLDSSVPSALSTLTRVSRLLSADSLRGVSLRDLRASASRTDPTAVDRARLVAPPTISTIAATRPA